MTQKATTSLSLHYRVKPSQKEGLLVEIKAMLDRCAKEPEFIMGIPHGPAELGLSAEWQRDWAREATVPGLAQTVVEHYGVTGTSFLWEQQLLNQGGSNRR